MHEKMKHKNKPKKVELHVSARDEKCKGGDLSFISSCRLKCKYLQ